MNNGTAINPKNPSPTETDELDFQPIAVSPFRLFGTSTTVSTANANSPKTPTTSSLKKFSSTTDKPRRKRTPKIDDNTDGQKVKRRKSEMTMNQKQLTLTELQTPITTEKKVNLNSELSVAKVKRKIIFTNDFFSISYLKTSSNYREIGFSPASSAQSDSGSNSNHTSESSTNPLPNSKSIQVNSLKRFSFCSNYSFP